MYSYIQNYIEFCLSLCVYAHTDVITKCNYISRVIGLAIVKPHDTKYIYISRRSDAASRISDVRQSVQASGYSNWQFAAPPPPPLPFSVPGVHRGGGELSAQFECIVL